MSVSVKVLGLSTTGDHYVLSTGHHQHIAHVFNSLNALNQMLGLPLEPESNLGKEEVFYKYREALNTFSKSPERNTTFFSFGTPLEVRRVLENCREHGNRIRIWYGNALTGESTLDEFDIQGRVGRSTGLTKVPLLLRNATSSGGGSILTSIVVRIDDISSRQTLYKHPLFNLPGMSVTARRDNGGYDVVNPDSLEVFAQFPSPEKAQNWIDFQQGIRYRT